MPRHIAAILVAAGRGERAGQSSEGPKQYRRIGGRPVIERTLAVFSAHPAIDTIVLVVHRDDLSLLEKAIGDRTKACVVVEGGVTRQESVRRGLSALADDAPQTVLIHDAVRPFVDMALIDRVIAAVDARKGAIPAIAVVDTLKRAAAGPDPIIAATVDRGGLYAAQTPQGFDFEAIFAAHRTAESTGRGDFTDDASIAEWAGLPVRLVQGDADNVKLTTAHDIALADARLATKEGAVNHAGKDAPVQGRIDVRTGNGYDVHQLVDGSHVTLCGVRIAHDRTLSGHSDADVGLHALTDALLATCGAGDIGDHFPPSDPQWRGAASRLFVEKAVAVVAGMGGRIMNADISLICEAPKIAPHREAMRQAIADMTGLSLERVSVKATTNETIGFVGRREGIAAIATASVVYGEGS